MRGKLWLLALVLALLPGCGERAGLESAPAVTPEAEPVATTEVTPTPDRGDLTEEEVERINEAFHYHAEAEDGDITTRPVNGFFLSHYADVKEMDLGTFLLYYPDDRGTLEPMSDDEREAMDSLPCFEGMNLKNLMNIVPLHRISRASVDETLTRYAGITTEDLTNKDGAFYMPDYEVYYTFTSDYGPGTFVCEGGRVEGDTAVLWTAERWGEGWREELTLKREGEGWYIRSFLRVALDREKSLDTFLLGLTGEEIEEVSTDWGFGNVPEKEQLAESIREAAQNRSEEWEYEREGTTWGMTVYLKDGTHLGLGTSVAENIVKTDRKGQTEYFYAPELYWLLRTEYDSEERENVIDQEAYETYQAAVDSYLTQEAWDPAVRVKLTDFYARQERAEWDAQVWVIGMELTTDPPELAVKLVGNGYVDSKLRMYPITDCGSSNLLVTMDGEVLGFHGVYWLMEEGGLEQYDTVEELRAEFGK